MLVRYFVECLWIRICLLFFSWLDWGCGVWGGKPERLRVIFITYIRVHSINKIYHCWYWPWSPGSSSVCQVSPLLLYVSLPYGTHWKKVTICSPHLRNGELRSTSLKAEYLHKSLGILLQRRCVSTLPFIYSIIYLNQCGLKDIYFILWVIIQYYFILLLKLFQLWPLGALSIGSCVPLIYPYQCKLFSFKFCFVLLFEHFLTFWLILHILPH